MYYIYLFYLYYLYMVTEYSVIDLLTIRTERHLCKHYRRNWEACLTKLSTTFVRTSNRQYSVSHGLRYFTYYIFFRTASSASSGVKDNLLCKATFNCDKKRTQTAYMALQWKCTLSLHEQSRQSYCFKIQSLKAGNNRVTRTGSTVTYLNVHEYFVLNLYCKAVPRPPIIVEVGDWLFSLVHFDFPTASHTCAVCVCTTFIQH